MEGRQAVRVASYLGEQTPLYCTAGGKVFLAYGKEDLIERVVREGFEKHTPNTITDEAALIAEIKQIRKKGYAFGLEEYGLGSRSVVVPVFDFQQNCIAAISLALPLSRSSKKRLREIAKILMENSQRITSKMML